MIVQRRTLWRQLLALPALLNREPYHDAATRRPKQFIALYMEPLVKLMDTRDRAAHATYEVLAMCADPYGWCYPGDHTSARSPGYSPQTIVGRRWSGWRCRASSASCTPSIHVGSATTATSRSARS